MPSVTEVETARETCQHILNEPQIDQALQSAGEPDKARLEEILAHAREREGLSLGEVAWLTHIKDPASTEALFETAAEVKRRIYGDRVVLFAPLYVSNECVGNCLYCAFRKDNDLLERRTLTAPDVQGEVEWLINQGYRRLLLVFGEHPHNDVHAMARAVEAVYATKTPKGEIRRVNINAAPLSRDGFEILQPSGIGTYQVFQETYHRETYRMAHPIGPKANYDWRLSVWDRCIPAGITDTGLGVLFGLYDWRWELLALLQHAAYLDTTYGVGPHTISVPRLEPAYNAPFAMDPPYPLNDDDFKRVVSIIRLAVPYTGMILSTRESPQMRNECMRLGISQVSAGSSVSPGGYTEAHPDEEDAAQFVVGDHRNLDQVMHDLCDLGYLPSFCTACYRSGRTGQDFMALAKPGEIHHYCLPNALLTFKEYLLDSASPETREVGEKAIVANLALIEQPGVRAQTEAKLAELDAGKRDVFF